MSNELTDVRCPCGDEYPADSYDAGFIAGSGMCQNCDAALPPKDICTCPSGDGSLAHPCPAHPTVEQAGGDERAAFEQWEAEQISFVLRQIGSMDTGDIDGDDVDLRFEDADGRDTGCDVSIVEYADKAANLIEAMLAERAALVQSFPTIATAPTYQFHSREIGESDWAPCDFSWYLYCSKSPEMDTRVVEVTAQPSPAQAEQAEAERTVVVARVVHSNPFVLDHCGPLNANDELMTVAQHAASVARWAEMFNRVEQERDAALAEVERLRESKGDPVGSLEKCMKVMYERDENAKRLEAALARVAELEKELAMARDAAAKGDAARHAAGGMEMEIHELKTKLAELEKQEPVAWGAFHFGGKRDGKLYTQCETEAQIEAYILDMHRSSDSLTLRKGPLYAAPVAQAQQLNDLDKQCRDDVARALGLRPSQERGFAWSYLLASIKSCVKASEDAAQAQHSVPEEFIGRLSEFLAQRGATGKALLRELRTMLATAGDK